jgi:hypothetical protein
VLLNEASASFHCKLNQWLFDEDEVSIHNPVNQDIRGNPTPLVTTGVIIHI